MKRFWATAGVEAVDGGHAVRLDGRPVRTPKGQALVLPNAALADAVAGEWQAVAGEVRPQMMPLTGFANAAIDIVAIDRPAFADGLAAYAAADLTCYRAEGPPALVALQVARCEPPLKAVEQRHGIVFRRTAGILPVAQPAETLARVRTLLTARPAWELAPLQPIVTITGSAVLALALLDGVLTADAAFAASTVDESWQAEQWGEDAEAAATRVLRQAEFASAARFLAAARS